MTSNSFGTRQTLEVGGTPYTIYSLETLAAQLDDVTIEDLLKRQ